MSGDKKLPKTDWKGCGNGHGKHEHIGSPMYYSMDNAYPDEKCPECGEKTDKLIFTSAGYPIDVCPKCAKRRSATLICECPSFYGYTDDEVPDMIKELIGDDSGYKERYPKYWQKKGLWKRILG